MHSTKLEQSLHGATNTARLFCTMKPESSNAIVLKSKKRSTLIFGTETVYYFLTIWSFPAVENGSATTVLTGQSLAFL